MQLTKPPYTLQEPVLKCYPTSEELNAVVSTINKIRSDNKLPPLTQDTRLDTSATKKAEDMTEKGYWSHEDPDGKPSWGMIKDSGYNYAKAGENLAQNYNNINGIEAWLQSPSHLKNILNPDFTNVGIGSVGKIKVLHFGKENKR